jgi:hypothetical protein
MPITTALNMARYSNEGGIMVNITIDKPPLIQAKVSIAHHLMPTFTMRCVRCVSQANNLILMARINVVATNITRISIL